MATLRSRACDWERPLGEQDELALESIFRQWRRRPIDSVVQPGERYQLTRSVCFGRGGSGSLDEGCEGFLEEKKFLRWESLGADGEIKNSMPGERTQDVGGW